MDEPLDNYWSEVSDLTIFHAAFWMQLRDDPRHHDQLFANNDRYESHFYSHPGGYEAVCEKCGVIFSAVRAGLITVTADIRGSDQGLDPGRACILKSEWIAWCRQVGDSELADWFEGKTERQTELRAGNFSLSASPLSDWREKARVIADTCFDSDTKNNCRDSLLGYSKRVMNEMQEQRIHGPRGLIDNPRTIQREALQAGQWWASKSK
jgi:hypothetical protein